MQYYIVTKVSRLQLHVTVRKHFTDMMEKRCQHEKAYTL